MRILLLGGKEKRNSDLHITVHMPKSLILLLQKLTDELSTEFSIILYGKIEPYPVIHQQDDKVTVTVTDYYIPKQRASAAYVDIEEYVQPIRNGHKVLGTVHKHPSGITSFSYTDHEHTNTKFPFNLLYVPDSYSYYSRYSYLYGYGSSRSSSSLWKRVKSVLSTASTDSAAHSDDDDISSYFTEASIWCLTPTELMQHLCELHVQRGEEIEISAATKSTSELIAVHADVCYNTGVEVKLYSDGREDQVNRILKEALKKIKGMSYSYQHIFETEYDVDDDDIDDELAEEFSKQTDTYRYYGDATTNKRGEDNEREQ